MVVSYKNWGVAGKMWARNSSHISEVFGWQAFWATGPANFGKKSGNQEIFWLKVKKRYQMVGVSYENVGVAVKMGSEKL